MTARLVFALFFALLAFPALAAEPYTLILTPPQVQDVGEAPSMAAAAESGGAVAGGLAPCNAPLPVRVARLALQKLQRVAARPERAVATDAYCTPEQRPAVAFVRVMDPALCGATGYCGVALLRQHEGRWRTLWSGSVLEGEDQMLSPEPDGQGGLRFWFEYADDEQRTVREGWRLVPDTAVSADCVVPVGRVSAKPLDGGALQLCARWPGKPPAQAVTFQPTMPYDTGIVSWPPYRLAHATGAFAPPSPGEGAAFIEAFRPLEVAAVCRQPSGAHALLVQQQCEGTGCAPLMRRVEQDATGWREHWMGDRGWKPLQGLLRCGAGEQALNLDAPFKPCACVADDAQSPVVAVAAFEQALRARGAVRSLPMPDNDPLELWLHAEGPEMADLASRWSRLWQSATTAPLQRLDDLDADGYRVQRLRMEQGWETAEWAHVHHGRSGLRAWVKAPLIDSRRGETVFSRETEWTLHPQGVLRVGIGRAAGGGAAQWRIAEVIERWRFKRVER